MKPYLRVTLGYALFGVTWILVSDQVVAAVARDSLSLSHFQTMKGAFYVLASAALVYGLSRKAFEQQAAAQREREQFFHKTIEGSHHILMNYLNSMQLLTLEAENCPAMDPATLKTARDSTATAAAELKRLAEIEHFTTTGIDAVVYRDLRHK